MFVKRIAAGLVLAATLTFAGCQTDKSILAGGTSATAPIANPIGMRDIYGAKSAYAGAVKIAVSYRRYCWSKPYQQLMADPIAQPICQDRRNVVRKLQAADVKAFNAITAAERFAANNPRLSAVTVVGAAWSAVADYQAMAIAAAAPR